MTFIAHTYMYTPISQYPRLILSSVLCQRGEIGVFFCMVKVTSYPSNSNIIIKGPELGC